MTDILGGRRQRDLADSMGVAQASISRWLSGKRPPRLDTLLSLAATLGVSVATLIEALEEHYKE